MTDLRIEDAAKRVGLHSNTLYKAWREGWGPDRYESKKDGLVYIKPEDIDRWYLDNYETKVFTETETAGDKPPQPKKVKPPRKPKAKSRTSSVARSKKKTVRPQLVVTMTITYDLKEMPLTDAMEAAEELLASARGEAGAEAEGTIVGLDKCRIKIG